MSTVRCQFAETRLVLTDEECHVFSSSWAGVMAGGLAAAVTPLDC